MTERDVIIVGGGPAGLNAALILGRARRKVLLFDDGEPRNGVADQMHGFISRDGTPPLELLQIARRELNNYPTVELLKESIERATPNGNGFSVTSESGNKFIAKRLLLAHGVKDKLPPIENLSAYWGRSVFVCPFCDGWEFRDRNIAVYGRGEDAVGLAQELYGWSKHISVCFESGSDVVSAKSARWLAATGCQVSNRGLQRLIGDALGTLEAIELDDDERIPCHALFLCAPLHQSCSIAQSLGCQLDAAGAVVVNDQCETTVAGCYAAGDAVLGVHQAILAAASGVKAAIAMSTELLCSEADLIAREAGS